MVTRDSLNYRKLTDKPEQEEAGTSEKAKPMEIDAEKLVAGKLIAEHIGLDKQKSSAIL